jgi:translation elongation factor EF-4
VWPPATSTQGYTSQATEELKSKHSSEQHKLNVLTNHKHVSALPIINTSSRVHQSTITVYSKPFVFIPHSLWNSGQYLSLAF